MKLTYLSLLTAFSVVSSFSFGSLQTLQLENWEALIDPATLKVSAKIKGVPGEILLSSASNNQEVGELKNDKHSTSWRIPKLKLDVSFHVRGNRLHAEFTTRREQEFVWPVSGTDTKLNAVVYADGEGLYIPIDDAFWVKRLTEGGCLTVHSGLTLPIWAYHSNTSSFTYIVPSDLHTKLCFRNKSGRLFTATKHQFRARDGFPSYRIIIAPGGQSPIAAGFEYRRWLKENEKFVSLEQKINTNPEVTRLLGAMHAYLYGDARSMDFLDELQKLGIDRFWLGYDQDPRSNKHLVKETFISRAKSLGYLVGPYDTMENVQHPDKADAICSIFDLDIYENGCVVEKNGKCKEGYLGRGRELSSEALDRLESTRHYIRNRVQSHVKTGINSYFLDVDGYGALYDDYSDLYYDASHPHYHPMTPAKDRRNRLKRMQFISESNNMVLGSETVVGWATPVVHFSHGTFSVHNNIFWPLMGNQKKFGGWWPPERPKIFFKKVVAGDEFREAKYNPTYRIPLFQSVFHDAIISTDRWELSYLKFPNIIQVKALIELLSNVPSIWNFDLAELRNNRQRVQKHFQFFSPIHRQTGNKPLTDFRWLTEDKKVQQTRFGDDLLLTANFGKETYQNIKPMCIRATFIRSQKTSSHCPNP